MNHLQWLTKIVTIVITEITRFVLSKLNFSVKVKVQTNKRRKMDKTVNLVAKCTYELIGFNKHSISQKRFISAEAFFNA